MESTSHTNLSFVETVGSAHRWVAVSAIVVAIAACPGVSADPWADAVVGASADYTASGLYDDPAALLGSPTQTFFDPFAGAQFVTSPVVGVFNLDDPGGDNVITTINAGQFIKLRFDEPVADDPLNPFGVDMLVFGNAFFSAGGGVGAGSDMEALHLSNPTGVFSEPVTVAVSSTGIGDPVSHPDEWYAFNAGPFADAMFPTGAFRWDRDAGDWGDPLDFTKPVDPALAVDDFHGVSVADAIDLYERSGGGTGFDLAESGFDSIQYVYLTGTGGEVDAVTDVSPDISWQQFHGTAQHAGVWVGEIRRKATVAAWSAGSDLKRSTQPAVSHGGTSVFVLGDAAIHAFDTASGAPLWSSPVYDGAAFLSASSPVYDGGYVYFGGGLGGEATVYKINAANGSTDEGDGGWVRALAPEDVIVNTSVTVAGETVYIHTDGAFAPTGSRLYALAAGDGSDRWVADDGGSGSAAVAFDVQRNLIYDFVFVDSGHTLRAYDASTGAESWTGAFRTDSTPFAFGIAYAGDRILFPDFSFSEETDSLQYSVDAGSGGGVTWSTQTPGGGDACTTVDPQGNSYTIAGFAGPGRTRAYDADGNTLWTFDAGGGWQGSAAWADDVVFVGDQVMNDLYLLDDATGSVLRRLVGSGPVAFGEDRFFSVGVDGVLYAHALRPLCDIDEDGDVDLDDYALFEACRVTFSDQCALADADADGDIDLRDFAMFQVVVGD